MFEFMYTNPKSVHTMYAYTKNHDIVCSTFKCISSKGSDAATSCISTKSGRGTTYNHMDRKRNYNNTLVSWFTWKFSNVPIPVYMYLAGHPKFLLVMHEEAEY